MFCFRAWFAPILISLDVSLVLWISSLALPAAAQPASAAKVSAASNLDLLSGEYTNPDDPGSPLSFYVRNGALTIESDRLVPMPLTSLPDASFALPDSTATFQFTRSGTGRGESVIFLDEQKTVYPRTGAPVHHVFHDYRLLASIEST